MRLSRLSAAASRGASVVAILLATGFLLGIPSGEAVGAASPDAASLAVLRSRLAGAKLVRVHSSLGLLDVHRVHLGAERVSWERVVSWSVAEPEKAPYLVTWPEVQRIQRFRTDAGKGAALGGLVGGIVGIVFATALNSSGVLGETDDLVDPMVIVSTGVAFIAVGVGIGAGLGSLSKSWVTVYDANPAGGAAP
jgi:hypothetical protein